MSAFTDDRWYRREIVTPELDECCDLIAAGLGIPRGDVGTKGDEDHRRGHHRSQEWILNSPFCTNRTYTVQAGLTDEQLRHIAAIDITPGAWGTTDNRRKVAAITARVIAAMKAGELDEVLEVYGAAADLRTVTGWNNRENRTASSNDSHLDHTHLGVDRRKLRDRAFLQRLAQIVIGDDMSAKAESEVHALWQGTYFGGSSCGRLVPAGAGTSNALVAKADYGLQLMETILAAVKGDADTAAILARIDQRAAELRAGLVADIIAALPDDGPVDVDTVEAALRRVLGGVDGATPGAPA